MNRQFIKLPQFIGEIIAVLINLAALVYGIIIGITIKEPIPTHYDINGNADGYGSAWTVLIMPVTILVLDLIMIYVIHFSDPGKWNMPFKLNVKNVIFVYHDFTWMLILLMILFSTLSLSFVIMLPIEGASFSTASIIMLVLVVPIIAIPTAIAAKHNKM